MNQTLVEILKALGYPLASVVTLVVLAYLGRQFFQKLLESVVARDLEAIKNQNAIHLMDVRKEHNFLLENRKAELNQEIERLKSTLSVEAETYRLAAQKRFEALLDLWQSSESLIERTNFNDLSSIKKSLSKVEESIGQLNRYSVLLSKDLLKQIKRYLEETTIVLTSSEKEIEESKIDPQKKERIEALTSAALGLIPGLGGLASALGNIIVPSVMKTLEKFRYNAAIKARGRLEEALRIEFGVQDLSRQTVPEPEKKEQLIQPPKLEEKQPETG